MNQCDGCRRRLPIVDGVHLDFGYDMIGCIKDRYEEENEQENPENEEE